MFDSDKYLSLNEWLVFNELAATANAFGELPNEVTPLADCLPLSHKQISVILGQFSLRGIITITSDRIIINDDWKIAAFAGIIQIKGVLNWHVLCYARTPGFLLKNLSTDLLTGFINREHPSPAKSGKENLLLSSNASDEPRVFGSVHSLVEEDNRRLASATRGYNNYLTDETGTINKPPAPLMHGEIESERPIPHIPSGSGVLPLAPAFAGRGVCGKQKQGRGPVPKSTFLPAAVAPDLFERFWDVYPRRDKKAEAIRLWNKAIKSGIDPVRIYEGAKRYGLYTRTLNWPFNRTYQACNFIAQTSFDERWEIRSKPSVQVKPMAYKITTFKVGNWRFDLWSNMHPEAAKITAVGPSTFKLGDKQMFFSNKRQIFMTYEEMQGLNQDGSPYTGPRWWKSAFGRRLIAQKRAPVEVIQTEDAPGNSGNNFSDTPKP